MDPFAKVVERAPAGSIAGLTRAMLRDRRVLAVALVGGPGCGKSSLIDVTIKSLMPDVHVGALTSDFAPDGDRRVTRQASRIVQLSTDAMCLPTPLEVAHGLSKLDADWLDLLLIETVGEPAPPDLGQELTVAVFSAAAGHDTARRQPDLVRAADAVVLNKLDLVQSIRFNLETFGADVKRLNPQARLFQLSASRAANTDEWFMWLKSRLHKHRTRAQAI